MALHRDIYWVGRQWAVTGYGLQACDQKQKSQFDIEASRLWEDGVEDSIRALKWLNIEDFDKALAVARDRYPEPPRKTPRPAPRAAVLPVNGSAVAPIPPAQKHVEPKVRKVDPDVPPVLKEPAVAKGVPVEPPYPAELKFDMRFAGRARFVRPWRVLVKR